MWHQIIYFALNFIWTFGQQPLFNNVGQIKCDRSTRIINDCNWCYCDSHGQFVCATRVCGLVDMNGHFNDAIQDLNIGMEGHGVWRSDITACKPNVHYKRDQLLCVCTEDGNWPNPVCRDVFRILHPIEPSNPRNNICKPNKLVLVGCNACYCPINGIIDTELCTNEKCDDNDPLINGEEHTMQRIDNENNMASEIYAECDINVKYRLGCRSCDCLSNNRLLCGDCAKDVEISDDDQDSMNVNIVPIELKNSASCPKGKSYKINCNYCFCLPNGNALCTARHCK